MLKEDHAVEIELAAGTKECPIEICDRIEQLIQDANHVLFIAINGAGNNVGKTHMRGLIATYLTQKDIPHATTGIIEFDENLLAQLESNARNLSTSHPGVIVSDAYQKMAFSSSEKVGIYRAYMNGSVVIASRKKIEKIGLWVGIYRPDKTFGSDIPVADILVNNKGAQDK